MVKRGARFTITDDSHCPEHVAIRYDDVRKYLIDNGVQELYRLKRTTDSVPGIKGTSYEAVPLADLLSHKAWVA